MNALHKFRLAFLPITLLLGHLPVRTLDIKLNHLRIAPLENPYKRIKNISSVGSESRSIAYSQQ